jgi:phage baseplate assembly protein gpV
MNDPVAIIRAIIKEELRGLRLGDIAVVTSVFPHTDESDANNYECNVKLRESNLELRKVPIATPHIGCVSTPQVDDLVLLSYVGGDPNRAVVVGRLYSDKARPPVHDEKEWRVEAPFKGKTSLAIGKDGALELTAGKTRIVLHEDDKIEIFANAELTIEVKEGNVNLKCTDCKIDASGNIDLGDSGSGVITENSHKCYFTGNALVGSKTVKAKD